MANIMKYKRADVVKILNHNSTIPRLKHNHSNLDIDKSRTKDNIVFYDGGYEDYKKTLESVYCLNRKDVNTLAEVVITQPKEFRSLSEAEQLQLWQECFQFLLFRYSNSEIGSCIQAIVHKDEAGEPHMHFVFIPMVKDPKKGYKVCFDKLCNRQDYRTFHSDLERYMNSMHKKKNLLKKDPIQAKFKNPIGWYYHTGITAAQGGNYNIKDVKRDRAMFNLMYEKDTLTKENAELMNRITELEQKVSQLQENENTVNFERSEEKEINASDYFSYDEEDEIEWF